ncbi:MAG: hypothetical protein JOZ16_08150 [Methylobacteriaceae bacterium]|nr:hypothetical protein [Methylobacteriaceae bacterium]
MPRVRFDELLAVYRNTEFGADDEPSRLTVATADLAALLTRLEADEAAAEDTDVALLDEIGDVAVGSVVRVRIGSPRVGLGVLARDVDMLLAPPAAKMREPASYYLVDPPYASADPSAPEVIGRYRKVLELVALLSEVATFQDATRAELVLVKDEKIVMPVRYGADDLARLDVAAADRLLTQMADELHRDQKLEILFEALVDLCAGQQAAGRFQFILRNLGELGDAVRKGYRLFASNFSYSKIRSEIEDARIEFAQKIHKTIVDVQGQLLGIPVATVVVASEMKAPTACGAEPWVNRAVLIGAWIFVILLTVAIINQLLTLNVIKSEVDRQKEKLRSDFPAVSDDFVKTFDSLGCRIWWHRVGLCVVILIGIGALLLANRTYEHIAAIPQPACEVAPSLSDQ